MENFLLLAFQSVVQPYELLLILIGVIFGIIAGAIPGFTVTLGIVLGLPFTFGMPPVDGIAFLVAILIGGYSGGQISGIMLGVPGTPSSITTVFDGYPLAKKGEPGFALGLGIAASIFGTIFSVLVLAIIGPLVARVSLRFESWEMAALIVFALTLVGGLSGKQLLKGLIAAGIGLLVALPGIGPYGNLRFNFGIDSLSNGFGLLPVLIGAYAFGQLLSNLSSPAADAAVDEKVAVSRAALKVPYRRLLPELWRQKWNLLRSCSIGSLIGALPALGGSVATFVSYDQAKKASKHPETYGTGAPGGVVASEAANNSVIGGVLIPTLTLGIPGDLPTAAMLGVLILHGITPGPLLFETEGLLVGAIYVTLLIGAVMLAFIMFPLVRAFAAISIIPMGLVIPAVLVLSAVGAFALNNNLFDVWSLWIFGLVGYWFFKNDIPLAPFILGVLLGPILEDNLIRALQLGPLVEFITRPISLGLLILSFGSIMLTVWQSKRNPD